MQIAVLGIDLGKNSCSVAGSDATGRIVLRRRMHRDSVIKLASRLPSCVMAMEACCGAHHLGRILRAHGHEVRLMSPEYVQPYVKAQKNDERDAEAIAEAATRPTMRFVELKSAMQLDARSLHRARSRLVGERTALINQLRAVLLERGVTVAQGRRRLERYLAVVLDGDEAPTLQLSPRMRLLVDDMRAQWCELDRRIAAFDAEFVATARSDETARRLSTIPGIGAINATALVAAIGDARSFLLAPAISRPGSGLSRDKPLPEAGPDCSALPSAGAKYLRTLLMHGAQAALPSLAATEGSLGNWLRGLSARAHRNTVIVALASKLARIAWAVLRSTATYNAALGDQAAAA